ncbi:MAG: FAD binding domain-containing protein [Sulfitobacter sp.]|nr:FAD binding domain-containing protein [Sulfitobacter sp.]
MSYHRPRTLTEALDLLAASRPRIAAGCTDLLAATERKILPGEVLDITAIEGLRGIDRTDAGLRIGATTTWSDLLKAPLPPALDGLKAAAAQVGARQIQNQASIAGNLCNASPAADGMPPLLILDAEVELASAEARRRLPLSEFVTGPRRTALDPGEMVIALHIPETALAGSSAFLKLGARTYLVISIAMTAARIVLRDGVVEQAALAIGACGPVARRLPDLEARLTGQRLDPALVRAEDLAAVIDPIDDMRADAAYRATSATELMRRVLAGLAEAEAMPA